MHGLLQDIRRQVRGMFRYRWLAMVVAWTCCVLGWVSVFSMPNVYEARAQVYVDAQSRLAKVMGLVGVSPSVGSQVFVVRQAMLARPQLERVALDTGLSLRANSEDEKEELIMFLRENVVVETGRRSETQNLYSISFQDSDRQMAIRVVQKLLDTFVEDVLDMKEQGSEQVDSYLDEQLTHYNGKLSEAETRLAEFKKRYVGLLPGESGGVFERLQFEMNSSKQLQADLQIEVDRRDELRRQLTNETPYQEDDSNGMLGVGVPGSTTQNSIRELEARRGELLLSYTERHPDVVAIDEQLAQLYDKRIDERNALRQSDGGMEGAANATNPVYQSAQIALNESSVKIAGLRSQLEQQRSVVRLLNNQVDSIPEIEAEYAQLTRDYAQYNVLYDEILVRKERERMGKVGEDRDVVSFNIIEPPAAALDPVAPRRAILLIGVFILSMGAGIATAFALHQLHPVFHDVQSLRVLSGQPVLGAISMTWLDRYRYKRRAGMASFMLVGTVLVLLFVATLGLEDFALNLVQSLKTSVAG
jgi:polysaccharide chain length determinant protein (PEP-CTERM system associated)